MEGVSVQSAPGGQTRGTTNPTPTPATGAFTSVLATVNWTKNGNRISLDWSITVNTLGTAAGAFSLPMPFTNGGIAASGAGTINATAVGMSCFITAGTATLSLRTAAGATPGGSCFGSIDYDLS